MANEPKVTFTYTNRRTAWTESHYHTSTDAADVVMRDARTLGSARIALFGEQTILANIAISYPDNLGDSYTAEPDVRSTVIPAALLSNDELYTCIKVRVRSVTNGNFRKILYLAGIPDNLILQAGKTGPTTVDQWNGWFRFYMDNLCGGGDKKLPSLWGFMAKDQSGVSVGRNPITAFAYNAGVVTITTKTNHGFAPRDKVQIRGLVTDLLGLISGSFYVTAIPLDTGGNPINNQFQFPAQLVTGVLAKDLTRATVEKPNPQFRAYNAWDRVQFGTRKRGGSRLAPRGRKRTRRRGS